MQIFGAVGAMVVVSVDGATICLLLGMMACGNRWLTALTLPTNISM